MLQHYEEFIFSRESIAGVSGIDITIGGDHGKGCFWMMLKLILRYLSNKKTFSEKADTDYGKEDITVIKETVLKSIGKSWTRCVVMNARLFDAFLYIYKQPGDSLQVISSGGHFTIQVDEWGSFQLKFSKPECEGGSFFAMVSLLLVIWSFMPKCWDAVTKVEADAGGAWCHCMNGNFLSLMLNSDTTLII